MKIKIINLTPHTVKVYTENGLIEFLPSGQVTRVKAEDKLAFNANNIDFFNTEYSNVLDLPPEKNNTIFIVSALVRLTCPKRFDLASPGELVRNEKGEIIGCKSFIVNSL